VKALFSHLTLKSLQVIAALQKIYSIKWNLHKTQATVDLGIWLYLGFLKIDFSFQESAIFRSE
jgi:hypothetical protein